MSAILHLKKKLEYQKNDLHIYKRISVVLPLFSRFVDNLPTVRTTSIWCVLMVLSHVYCKLSRQDAVGSIASMRGVL